MTVGMLYPLHGLASPGVHLPNSDLVLSCRSVWQLNHSGWLPFDCSFHCVRYVNFVCYIDYVYLAAKYFSLGSYLRRPYMLHVFVVFPSFHNFFLLLSDHHHAIHEIGFGKAC